MTLWLSIGFMALTLLILIPELIMLRRSACLIGTWEALAWTAFWVVLALVFNVALYFAYEHQWLGLGTTPGHELDGRTAALQFFTGYIVQKSLSVDNVFVIAMIFAHFSVPLAQQQRLLGIGLIGAVVMRGLVVAGGIALIHAVPWTAYVFGVLLIFTALRMLAHRSGEFRSGNNLLIRLIGRRYPVVMRFEGDRFLTSVDGRRTSTPLLPALIMVGSANLVFAVDAVPAIIAITQEPLIVLAAIVFALLGLHSLYFLLASIMHRLYYLKLALVGVLAFVGVKMLLANHYPVPTAVSLAFIASALMAGASASALVRPPAGGRPVSLFAAELEQFVTLTLRSARRIAILVTGSTVLLVGVLMIVTPGPAVLVIPVGLAILATEFIWARRLLRRFRKEAKSLSGSVWKIFGRRKHRQEDRGE